MTDTVSTRARIDVTRLAGNIGAEISGVDTGEVLSDEAVAQIRQALLDHKVVFLRDQDLDYARQVTFAERLGPLTLGHPTLASPPDQPSAGVTAIAEMRSGSLPARPAPAGRPGQAGVAGAGPRG